MKNTYTHLLAILLGFSSLGATAQTQLKETKEGISTEQQLVELYGNDKLLLQDLPANSANRAVLSQEGNSNLGNIDQRLLGMPGNAATILQQGNVNTAIVTQTGAGNSTTVRQTGNRNTVSSDIDGYNTESTIIQNGNNNRVSQDLSVDDRRYKVQQNGNNNELTQRESGIAAPPGYEIQMQGSGIRLTIEQGKVLP